MEQLIPLLIEFGYTLIFGMLGAIVLLTKTPKQEGLESYKKSRTCLGIGLIVIAVYCIFMFFVPGKTHENYVSFWLLVTFTLIHSWLTYASLLFLMETPRYLTKSFIIDGLAPTSLLLISGGAGLAFPRIQSILFPVFGIIFGIKCTWMFYICRREFNKCKRDLENHYGEIPDIKWINSLIYISLFMSIATIVAFYTPQIHLFYYLAIPIIYIYIVLKINNFMPNKIDNVRYANLMQDSAVTEPPKKIKDLEEKLNPQIEKWISEKRFCTPEITIKDVAMEIGTNHNYLSQYLNNCKGVTFQIWLNTLRIEESKRILTSGEKISIEEVGIRVGIPQSYNFSRWFKVVTNMTPYQYRKQNS